MKPTITLTLSLLAALLGAGCVGSGPNTQQGAVGGAVAGALLGGIIGNNRGSGHAASGAAIGAAAGGLAGAAVGNSLDHERGTLYNRPDPSPEYVVQQPPPMPPPRREIVAVRPAREAIWVEGYYAYTGHGNRYEWVPGHWEIPPPHRHTYVRPGWQHRGHGYVYVRGYWR
jgi:hypothetical protein